MRAVEYSRTTMHVQFAVGIRQCEHGFLGGPVGYFTIGQDFPRDHSPVDALDGHICPTRTQQCLIGKRTVEADAIQERNSLCVLAILEKNRTQHEIGLVPDRQFGGIVGGYLASPLQLLQCRLPLIVLQVGNAQIV